MMVHTAKSMLTRDRMDWNRPHLMYLLPSLYYGFKKFRRRHG